LIISHVSCAVLCIYCNASSKALGFLDIMTTSSACALICTILVYIFPPIPNFFIIWGLSRT